MGDINTYLVIICKVAGLTHPNRVIKSIGMLTLGGVLFSTKFAVAR